MDIKVYNREELNSEIIYNVKYANNGRRLKYTFEISKRTNCYWIKKLSYSGEYDILYYKIISKISKEDRDIIFMILDRKISEGHEFFRDEIYLLDTSLTKNSLEVPDSLLLTWLLCRNKIFYKVIK